MQDVDYEIDQIVAAQQKTTGFDFGNFPEDSNLGGDKYIDSNKNGVKDPGELPVQGVKYVLDGTNDLGMPVHLETTTDGTGFYQFNIARPGTYMITEIPPDNFITGKAAVGTINGSTNGQVAPSQLVIFDIVFATGGLSGINYDFGEIGYKPPFVSKRDLLVPKQQTIPTAVYNNAAPVQTATAKTTSAKPAPVTTKKTTVKTPPKTPTITSVKIPIITTAKKTTKK